MRMEAERTDDLREAFASLGSPPSSGKECPEPDHLWRAAAGDLSGNEARTIVAHTSVCVSCSREWRLAKELGARPIDVPQETSETIGGAAGFWQIMNLRLVPAIAGVGFVVVVAILGLQYWPRATEPGFRGASDSQIVSRVPDDVALDRDVVNVLTHCNAGWLATVDYGTALAPIYLAHDEGIPVHVWVDETRPRSQGFLTAWELSAHGVPYTLIADNAGGHLMQRGQVDLVIVGADRVTRDGHVCNKIGTYLKALAAKQNTVPFYAAVPSPTIDWSIDDAFSEIPIEERSADEIRFVQGLGSDGQMSRVAVGTEDMQVANPGFDVTPAELITGIITEAGVIPATRDGLASIAGN